MRNIYTKWGIMRIRKVRGPGCYTYEQALRNGMVERVTKKHTGIKIEKRPKRKLRKIKR